jgi:hypothetical protein
MKTLGMKALGFHPCDRQGVLRAMHGTLPVDQELCLNKEIRDVVREHHAMPPARRKDVKPPPKESAAVPASRRLQLASFAPLATR